MRMQEINGLDWYRRFKPTMKDLENVDSVHIYEKLALFLFLESSSNGNSTNNSGVTCSFVSEWKHCK